MTSLLTRLGPLFTILIGCSGDTVETKEGTDNAPEEKTTGVRQVGPQRLSCSG